MSEFTVSCSCGRVMVTDTMRGRDAFRCGCGARVSVKATPKRRCSGRIDGEPCRTVPITGLPVDLCARHVAELKRMWRLVPDDEARDRVMVQVDQRKRRIPVVYYLLFADRIKIGTTVNLAERVREIPHDELLGAELGGRDLERERHQQFRSLRVNGEWFRDAPSLRRHIKRLPRVADLLRAPIPQRQQDIDSLTGVLLTAQEVAALLGTYARTVYQWERRGYLKARGLDECGNRLYDAGEAAMVASSPRRRNAA